MNKVNKVDLVEYVSDKAYISKLDAREAIDAVFEFIKTNNLNDVEVNISNFGTFVPLNRKSRIGTDPSTHKQIEIKARKSISFKPCKALKEQFK